MKIANLGPSTCALRAADTTWSFFTSWWKIQCWHSEKEHSIRIHLRSIDVPSPVNLWRSSFCSLLFQRHIISGCRSSEWRLNLEIARLTDLLCIYFWIEYSPSLNSFRLSDGNNCSLYCFFVRHIPGLASQSFHIVCCTLELNHAKFCATITWKISPFCGIFRENSWKTDTKLPAIMSWTVSNHDFSLIVSLHYFDKLSTHPSKR